AWRERYVTPRQRRTRRPADDRIRRAADAQATSASARGCRNIGAVRPGAETPVMALNFVSCDRGQLLLMPPSLSEWVPENHLVWTILGAVEVMDLGRFCDEYRLGAAGRPAYDPAMLGWIQLVVATPDVEELRCPGEAPLWIVPRQQGRGLENTHRLGV